MIQSKPLNGIDDEHIIVEMTIKEYLEFKELVANKKKDIGKGLADIMEMFKCSRATAFKVSHTDWFQPAIILRQGKLLTFDKDIALKLAKENSKIKLK